MADAFEALSRLAPSLEVPSLHGADRALALKTARTCYDHLAGRLGVALTGALVEREVLVPLDGSYDVTRAGEGTLVALGVDVAAARAGRRPFARACLDWTERRPHLAGALGAALAETFLTRGWVERRPRDRGLRVTAAGAQGLLALGVEL